MDQNINWMEINLKLMDTVYIQFNQKELRMFFEYDNTKSLV